MWFDLWPDLTHTDPSLYVELCEDRALNPEPRVWSCLTLPTWQRTKHNYSHRSLGPWRMQQAKGPGTQQQGHPRSHEVVTAHTHTSTRTRNPQIPRKWKPHTRRLKGRNIIVWGEILNKNYTKGNEWGIRAYPTAQRISKAGGSLNFPSTNYKLIDFLETWRVSKKL